MEETPAPKYHYEYIVMDEELSEEYGIIYQGTNLAVAKEHASKWKERGTVKLKRRQVTDYEVIPPLFKPEDIYKHVNW